MVDPGLLPAFDAGLAEGKDWLQGYYTVRNPDASWRTRMMTYAFSLANGVWMLGLERLGLGVGLKGNGMCFSSRGLRRFPWRAYGLVEDMEFALMLRARGERVRFLPEARVFGEMVSRGGPGAASQRRRWEAGRRALRGKFAGPLAGSESIGPYRKVMYLLDLFFPPLVTPGDRPGGGLERRCRSPLARRPERPDRRPPGGPGGHGGPAGLYALSPIGGHEAPGPLPGEPARAPLLHGLEAFGGARPAAQGWVRTPREPQAPA